MKKRVYEVAKELNITSKELMAKLDKLNIKYTSHMSTLEDDKIELLMKDKDEIVKKKKSSFKWVIGTPAASTAKKKKSPVVKKIVKTQNTDESNEKEVEKQEIKKESTNINDVNKKEDIVKKTEIKEIKKEEVKKQKSNIETKKEEASSKKITNKSNKINNSSEKKSNKKEVFKKSNNNFNKSNNIDKKSKKPDKDSRNKKFDKSKDSIEPINDAIKSRSKKKANKKKEKNNQKYEKNKSMELLKDKFSKKVKTKKKKKDEKSADISEFYDEENRLLLPEEIMVSKFAMMIDKKPAEVIMKLMANNIMANMNQNIDFETAELIALEYDIECKLLVATEEADKLSEKYLEQSSEDKLKERPPVVTVMGHVDHGKTSLLDAIRKTSVTDREQGGITQHIGASEATINNKRIVFLDTPGHEAFTTLRSRGAQVTDISILVVSADDGVMPQTIEAIDHSKAAGVPIIVAINKIDKPNANPTQVKSELAEHGVIIEEFGGDTICVEVSAKQGINIDSLLEMIILQADVMELKADYDRDANGTIIDAKIDRGRGTVATLLIQNGELKVGDSIVCGNTFGHVRAMYNHLGKRVKKAGPSTGVEITGINDIPSAGDKFFVVEDDKTARKIADKKALTLRNRKLKDTPAHVTLEDIFEKIQEGQLKELKILLKADVQGSIEALNSSLIKLSNDEVNVKIIHSAIGAISESDVLLASASDAVIIGFNVRPANNVKQIADREKVEIKLYRIIYEAINDVSDALKGMLDPEFKEEIIGSAEVRQLIKVPNVGVIAGCYVVSGKIQRSSQIRLIRDNIVIHEGKISSLKRFKDDVKEVATNYECGIGFENYNDLKENDIIEAFNMVEINKDGK